MQPTDNRLLAALPEEERNELIRMAQPIELKLGDVLYEQDEEVDQVHFLTSGGASVLILLEDGRGIEPAIVGREGILGFPFGIGDNRSRWQSVIELPGDAYAIDLDAFSAVLRRPDAELGRLLMHYSGLLLTFVTQSAVCAQFHSLQERASRWLLLLHDRAETDVFPITHDWLAHMLGAQRPSVTLALGGLASRGLITLHRGSVRVQHRAGLEAITCECYGRVRTAFDEVVQHG